MKCKLNILSQKDILRYYEEFLHKRNSFPPSTTNDFLFSTLLLSLEFYLDIGDMCEGKPWFYWFKHLYLFSHTNAI